LGELAATLHREHPTQTRDGEWIDVRPAGQYLPLDELQGVMLALVAALVMLVLVTACMNVGVLVLARTVGRDREFGLRLSVGASRGRLVRQLMTEHLMLGLLGAGAGCVVAMLATRALAVATDLPPGLAPHLTWKSLAFAAACAVLSAVLFGLTPALQAIRPSMARHLRLRSALLSVQVAAAGVLLIVSGLLVRGVVRVAHVDLGFDYRQTLLADPDLFAHGVKPAAASQYWRRVDARVRQIPGVLDAGVTTLPPFGNRVAMNQDGTLFYEVTPSYFSTLRIPLLRGRLFHEGEHGVAVISDTLARRQWPDGDPLGRELDSTVVIGVVGSARTLRIGEALAGEFYRPLEDNADTLGPAFAVMVVRTSGPPQDIAATVAAVARAEGPGLSPVVRPLSEALEETLAKPRQVVLIASSLGIAALLLAVTGVGGLIAYTVAQRTREIGIRIALGARPGDVVNAIVHQFRWPVIGGAIAGSLLAGAAGLALSRELFGVSPFDAVSHLAALLIFAVVTAVAAVPAVRRALRVDPVTTLRAE
jgi:predicted permease